MRTKTIWSNSNMDMTDKMAVRTLLGGWIAVSNKIYDQMKGEGLLDNKDQAIGYEEAERKRRLERVLKRKRSIQS